MGTYKRMELKMSRNGLEIMGRFRMGNETRVCEYWRNEEEKWCRLCESGKEIMKHVLKECEVTGKGEGDWLRYLTGDTRSLGRLNEIVWRRKRNRIQNEERDTEAP